jgi:alanyl-tRNA synthetase
MKSTNGQHLHLVKAIKKIQANDQAALAIDETFRKNISRNHTTEHLLEMVLNQNVSKTIKQEGAFKNDQYFTFDFKFDRKLSEQELKTVEAAVNDIIEKDYPITTSLMTYEETKNVPQLVGHFDDTYKQIKGKLRVVKIGDLNVEICGGTHVKSTGEIEQFMISEYLHKSSDM